jgi:hypothetical protein
MIVVHLTGWAAYATLRKGHSPTADRHHPGLKEREMPDVRITPLAVSLRQLPQQRFSQLRLACGIADPLSLALEIEIGERGEQGLK